MPHILGINKLEDLKLNKTNLIQKIKKQNNFKLKKNKFNRWEKVIEKITKIINNKINKKFNERISK